MDLRPHIEKFRRRFTEIEAALSNPNAFDNQQRAQEMSKEYARLKELVACGDNFFKTQEQLAENRALLQNEAPESELGQMAREEVTRLEAEEKKFIRAIRLSKFAPVLVVPNPRCSPPTFTGCIFGMPKRLAGKSSRLIPIRPTSAVSRRSFLK